MSRCKCGELGKEVNWNLSGCEEFRELKAEVQRLETALAETERKWREEKKRADEMERAMKSYEELQERVKELEEESRQWDKASLVAIVAENERLKAAIEWYGMTPACCDGVTEKYKELRARAFPPQEEEFEEVEYTIWVRFCANGDREYFDHMPLSPLPQNCTQSTATGIRRIPKRKKLLRREEIHPDGICGWAQQKDAKYYREWEE